MIRVLFPPPADIAAPGSLRVAVSVVRVILGSLKAAAAAIPGFSNGVAASVAEFNHLLNAECSWQELLKAPADQSARSAFMDAQPHVIGAHAELSGLARRVFAAAAKDAAYRDNVAEAVATKLAFRTADQSAVVAPDGTRLFPPNGCIDQFGDLPGLIGGVAKNLQLLARGGLPDDGRTRPGVDPVLAAADSLQRADASFRILIENPTVAAISEKAEKIVPRVEALSLALDNLALALFLPAGREASWRDRAARALIAGTATLAVNGSVVEGPGGA